MKNKVEMNMILNMIRQGMFIIFPLITYPYAVRVLGPESLGKVSYVQSIISYFSLFAMLGISNYAIREGARRRDDRAQLETFANEVFTINIIFTIISYIALILTISFIPQFRSYTGLMLLTGADIILSAMSIDWLNVIFEDFLIITIRSIIINFITFLALFLLVHNENDYYMYEVLSLTPGAVICFSNWIYCRKYLKLRITFCPRIKDHIFPLVVLFANSVAITVNTSFDTTMLGWIKGDYHVGLYSFPVKIITICKSMIFAIYAAVIARLSYFVGNSLSDDYKKLNTNIWCYTALLVVPTSFGMICVSSDITYIIGGEKLKEASFTLAILALSLLFSTFASIIMNAMNVSLRREKENLKATIVSAGLNVLLNIYFIPKYGHNGAAFTTVLSELFILIFLIVRFKDFRQYLDIKKFVIISVQGFMSSLLFIPLCYAINFLNSNVWISLCIKILFCVFAYFTILLILKNEIVISIWQKSKKIGSLNNK